MKASLVRLIAQMGYIRYVGSMAEYRNDTARTVGRKPHKIWSSLAVGFGLVVTACSGGSDASVPTVQLTSTAPTTVATTTTTEPTTTTEDPAIAYERDVAEITEVYGLLLAYHETYGVTANLPAMEEFAAEPLLSIKFKNVKSWEDQGFLIDEMRYDFEIIEVAINGDSATTISCNLDGGSLVTAVGAVVIPADTERYLVTATYERTTPGWRVTETDWGDLVSCGN